jgi:two-component system invasion response regulator UvrY
MFSIEVEPMIKILIADDHAIVREGLKQILSETPDMVVTAEAADGTEALDRVSKNDLDLVVLDISMPGRSGLDILKEIKSQWPELPVLILSMYPEEQYAARVLKAGASGYLTKESAPDELVNVIRKISQPGNM